MMKYLDDGPSSLEGEEPGSNVLHVAQRMPANFSVSTEAPPMVLIGWPQ
jgi:hypothetical protein